MKLIQKMVVYGAIVCGAYYFLTNPGCRKQAYDATNNYVIPKAKEIGGELYDNFVKDKRDGEKPSGLEKKVSDPSK